MNARKLIPCLALATALALPCAASADGPFPFPNTVAPNPNVRLGKARAPKGAPRAVRRIVTAANRIARKPYKWGGGHGAFTRRLARGYDCSGSVSYALYGARLLTWPLDSTGFMKFGRRGPGRWVTIYANKEHAYMVVAGMRFDTSMHDLGLPGPKTGPRWSAFPRPRKGFRAVHPAGL